MNRRAAKLISLLAFAVWLGPTAWAAPRLAVESFQAAWEIIRDTHWDTNYNGHNWEAVRSEFLPKVQAARNNEQVRDAIQEMLDLLGHSHLKVLPGPGSFIDEKATTTAAESAREKPRKAHEGGNGSIGVEVRPLNDQIVVWRVERGSPAEKAGVTPGWILKEIDGEPAVDATALKLSGRQRDFLLWHNAAGLLKGDVDEPCELLAETGAGEKRISIEREREMGEPAKLGNLPAMMTRVETNLIRLPSEKTIGYLRFNLWMLPAIRVIDQFVDANRNSDAIIIDLRGNVGGIGGMVMGAAGHFVNERSSLGKMKMRDNELNFIAFPRRVDSKMHPTNTFQGKLAILVDGISLSSTELFAGAMQEMGRARVFGEQTGGQALPAVSDRLPNGDLLYHAVADFNTPKGRRLEGKGVTPDEVVPLRLEALRTGKDEVLTAALRWIDSAPQQGSTGVK